MVFYDVNNTYVRVKENDVNAFYIRKSDVKKIELKDRFISVIGDNGSTILKSIWNNIDVFDEDPEVNDYTVQNSGSPTPAPTAEETLVAIHNAFFFRDGVGIDVEQLSNVDGEPGSGYILVYDGDINKWVPQAVQFDPSSTVDLSSNVSGLNRGLLSLRLETDAETGVQYRILLFNDVSNTQQRIVLPSDLSDTGQQTNLPITAKNNEAFLVSAGTPVHFTGTSGTSNLLFVEADASRAETMPAHGILSQDTGQNDFGDVVVFGSLEGLDTTSDKINSDANNPLEEGVGLYVQSGGGLTTIRPVSEDVLVQNVAELESVDKNQGKLLISGSWEYQDVPNLGLKHVFIGDGNNAYEKRQLNTGDIDEGVNLFFTDARARQAISAASGSTIEYDSTTGEISIDDSSYGGVTTEEVISSFIPGAGISLDSSGNLSVKIDGNNISFDGEGNIIITGIPTNTSHLLNDGDGGQSSFITQLEAAELLGDTEDRFPPNPQYRTLNMPTENGVVKTFGKYKHTDQIETGGKSVVEVLLDAFSDFVAPTPDINIDTSPDYNHQYTTFAFKLDIDFGVQNSGGVATGELFFKINSSGTYESLGSIPEGNNQTIDAVTIGAFNSSNDFFFKLEVTEGSSTVSAEDDISASGRVKPTVSNEDVSRVSTYSGTSNVGDLVREYGDLQTTYEADIQGNEVYVSLDTVYFQYYNSSEDWVFSGNQSLPSENVDNVQFTTPAGLAHNMLDTSSRIDARFLVQSIEDGTETSRYDPYEFNDVRFYLAYAICFSSTALTSTSPDADFQTIYDELQGDDNGYNVKAVLTTSGTYPSKIPNTGNINNTAGNTYMYIIYPSTNAITSFLDGGVSSALAGLVDLGNHNIQNHYEYTHSLRFYRTGASGSINNTFFSIG